MILLHPGVLIRYFKRALLYSQKSHVALKKESLLNALFFLEETWKLAGTVILCVAVCCSVLQCVVYCTLEEPYYTCKRARSKTYNIEGSVEFFCQVFAICNILQHTATQCNTLQHTFFPKICNRVGNLAGAKITTRTHCDTLTHSNTLQHTPTHSNTLHHTPPYRNTLQHTATHCNTLQHTATHCNTL